MTQLRLFHGLLCWWTCEAIFPSLHSQRGRRQPDGRNVSKFFYFSRVAQNWIDKKDYQHTLNL